MGEFWERGPVKDWAERTKNDIGVSDLERKVEALREQMDRDYREVMLAFGQIQKAFAETQKAFAATQKAFAASQERLDGYYRTTNATIDVLTEAVLAQDRDDAATRSAIDKLSQVIERHEERLSRLEEAS